MTEIKGLINENIDAKVDFESLNISLIKKFPNISISIHDLSIVNQFPFEGDTLMRVQEIAFKTSLNTLFKKDEDPYRIKGIYVTNPLLNVKVNKDSVTNYDIALKTDETTLPENADSENQEISQTVENSMGISLENYEITNLTLHYSDETMRTSVSIENFNHSGSGDFTADVFDLNTKTDFLISFGYDGVNYLDKNKIGLDAIFNIDLKNQIYRFSENTFTINQFKLHFDGAISMLNNAQQYDLKFNTPDTRFMSLLELIPKTYTQSLDGVKTKGVFDLNGTINGLFDETHIPSFDIYLTAKDAHIKYPDLPKSIDDIFMNIAIQNKTGLLNDTQIKVKTIDFSIDSNKFHAQTTVTNLMENPIIDALFRGTINLDHLAEAYPLPSDYTLHGTLNTDISAKFDMKSIETATYEKTELKGNVFLENIQTQVTQMPHPIKISSSKISFDNSSVQLQHFKANTGTSDFSMKGKINNILGFVFKDEILNANFSLFSNHFHVSDWVDFDEDETTEVVDKNTTENKNTTHQQKTDSIHNSETAKIPAFLDCTIQTQINELYYDNLILKNTKGLVWIKNETIDLKNLSFNIFDGQIILNGKASTKPKIPTFESRMNISKLDLKSTFTAFNTLKTIAPIGETVDGKFNATATFFGKLTPDLVPDTTSIEGEMTMALLNTKFNPKASNTISELNRKVPFLDLRKTQFNDVDIHLMVKDETVKVTPFDITMDDIKIHVKGQHGFNSDIDYQLNTLVPAHYLGGDVSQLLSQLGDDSKDLKVPFPIKITGNTDNPDVKVDLKTATKQVNKELTELLKKKATKETKKQLQEKTEELLDQHLNEDQKETLDAIKKKANNLLDGIFK